MDYNLTDAKDHMTKDHNVVVNNQNAMVKNGPIKSQKIYVGICLLPSPHLLVLATSERFLPAGDIFRVILASESH